MTIVDVLVGLIGGIAVVSAMGAAYSFGRAAGIKEAERVRFWADRGVPLIPGASLIPDWWPW